MLTIRAEVRKEQVRKDGSFNIKIRITQNRKIKRLSTKLFAKKSDLNKSLKQIINLKSKGMSFRMFPFFHQKALTLSNFSIQNLFKYDELVIFAA